MRRFVLLTAVVALLAPATAGSGSSRPLLGTARDQARGQPGADGGERRYLQAQRTVDADGPQRPRRRPDRGRARAARAAGDGPGNDRTARCPARPSAGTRRRGVELLSRRRGGGTRPPARFGTEVVARLLGLRKNHEAPQDALERLPSDPATRAEAAYSAAQILRFSGWELHQVEDSAAAFELPELTLWQRRILTTAFGRIGFPYVWGGESDTRVSPFGLQASGGFDCSGFAWRVFKRQAGPGGCAARADAGRPHGRRDGR